MCVRVFVCVCVCACACPHMCTCMPMDEKVFMRVCLLFCKGLIKYNDIYVAQLCMGFLIAEWLRGYSAA